MTLALRVHHCRAAPASQRGALPPSPRWRQWSMRTCASTQRYKGEGGGGRVRRGHVFAQSNNFEHYIAQVQFSLGLTIMVSCMKIRFPLLARSRNILNPNPFYLPPVAQGMPARYISILWKRASRKCRRHPLPADKHGQAPLSCGLQGSYGTVDGPCAGQVLAQQPPHRGLHDG